MTDRDSAPAFTGFPVEGLDFYDDLEADNTKTFWTAHKQVYLEAVHAPMTRLMELLGPEFGEGKLFRPYRDLRFGKDRTPYKTHQGGYVAHGPSTGWYVQLDAAGLLVAGGCYHPATDALARFRAAVADERTGSELEEMVAALAADGYAIEGERLRTRPRGYDADHPRIDLLRYKGLHATRRYDDGPAWLHTPEAAQRVRADWQAMTPLVEWSAVHVGPAAAQ